ncbi:hypothetical protein IC614_09260 [Allosphingosinicella flava]|uniref:Peptidase S1 domain-containing protein n=2 Tax=Allosphingosinicella flava TaxID=2771430 RepID=A0A7T2GM32_9SPHN|nr:hypothetical protein IC614_09260 [Sphingosinicella flava]
MNAFEALAQDARDYAARYGVSHAEALQRLRAQEDSVATTDRIREEYRGRFAGMALEHRPAFRIVVLLTGEEAVPDRLIKAAGTDVPVLFRTGAAATQEQVVASIRRDQAAIRAMLRNPPGLGHDPRTGALVVAVSGADADDYRAAGMQARLEALTGVPVRFMAVDRQEDLSVEGGARLVGVADGRRYTCTAGFAVTDGISHGIVTAAHCPDDISVIGTDGGATSLAFKGQWGWSYRDVQVHLSATPLKPLFYADSAKSVIRPVTSWRNRASMRAGDVVCHRGETTGYSCAEVEYTDFAPSGDLCGGPCAPTWVTVAGPVCKGGDSGAPVFNGTIAFGIVKGASYRKDGTCNFYYYMSTDFLPEGWRLLHE